MKKKLYIFLAAAIVASILLHGLDYFDSAQRDAVRFIQGDSEIRDQVGVILSQSLYKRYYVGPTESSGPYREYIYLVKGEKAQVLVTVRADRSTNSQYQFAITKIKRYQ
ncbi:hypothetical protein [Methyloversatilis sp.]|uniref:hypothetical protein n=1 Tax=Methyloversatilis sp. TaxID=2569862 RepID=UPI0035AF7877